MFKIGDLIIYGHTSVCRVKDITTLNLPLMADEDRERLYYILEPLYEDSTIYTPVDNPKVFMRPIISRERAEELIDLIPTMQAEPFHTNVLRELTDHYNSLLQTHDCEALL